MKKQKKASIKHKLSPKSKKLIFVSSIMFFMAASTCYGMVFAPEWTEFCPPKYCESTESIFSKDATYWYKRRIQFEKSIEKCSIYKDTELDNCYIEIREAEARKNKVWDVRQDEKYRTTEYNREYYMEKMKYDGINRMIENIKK